MNTIALVKSMITGLRMTLRHFFAARQMRIQKSIQEAGYFEQTTGIATVQYPKEKILVPDIGRYQLHVAIDDCIVCDLCARICPVDCIDIISIKSPEVFGFTSDGSKKRLHAEKFDIDMAKCMFCGFCTTVCPTECITMTDIYDRTEPNIAALNYPFASLTSDEATQKRAELAAFNLSQQQQQVSTQVATQQNIS